MQTIRRKPKPTFSDSELNAVGGNHRLAAVADAMGKNLAAKQPGQDDDEADAQRVQQLASVVGDRLAPYAAGLRLK